MNNYKRVLVLAPHTDDGEVGCGGTIAKFIEEGKEVYYVAFSCVSGLIKKELQEEIKNAMKVLGLSEKNLTVLNYKTRYFPKYRQAILENMIRIGKEINPDLVLLPSTFDTHQDHQVISQEGFRAFKKCSILGYEEPWNNLTFKTEIFSILKEEHIQKKLDAIDCYKSQAFRPAMQREPMSNLAKTRGVQIDVKYAEVFECIRLII